MIDALIAFSLKNRLLVVLFALGVVGGGIWAVRGIAIDAFPDVSPVLVEVGAEAPGLAPEEVEKLVTYPVEVAMNGLPGVVRVKSISAFGLSQVSVYFRDDVDVYFARQLVLERLQEAKEEIPPGLAEPGLGPITTGMGQIYHYTVGGPGSDPVETRTVEDWIVKRSLRTVPGVADVLSFGGEVKQYQVRIDPGALLQYGVTLAEVKDALGANNRNVGGGYITRGPEEYIVRGLGLAQSLSDLGNVVVASRNGTPVYVRNVAEVALGPEVRRGAVTMNGKGEVTTGIVLKRIHENTSEVIAAVKERVKQLNTSLPDGMKVEAFYDQAELVKRAVDTVRDALLEGALLIVVVLFLYLSGVRSALVVTAMLPLSLLMAFLLMRWQGLTANLMSLGGLAIGIGMMVDGGVVMVENVFRHLSEPAQAQTPRREVVLTAAREVGRPIVFAITIIVIVFLPLLTLEGVEGTMFRPMALAISFAMVGSLLFSLTVIPVLCSFFLRGGRHDDNLLMRAVKRPYLPALRWALRHRRTTLAGAVAALGVSLALVPFLGTEFVPELDEGSILYRVTMAPSAGLEEGIRIATEMETLVKSRFGEVQDVISKIGRAEIGGDPEPVNNIEAIVTLKPHDQWPGGRDKEALVVAMAAALDEVPGVVVGFSQPIATRVDELLSGVKSQLAISLFGDDLDQLTRTAARIEHVVAQIPGAADVQAEQITGQPQLQIAVDRNAIAPYGINVDDVQEAIETAVGGEAAGQVFEGIRRFDVNVRLKAPYRSDPQAIGNLLVPAPDGARVPLSQLATISTVVGPKRISHDDGQRRIVIQLNVRGRDLGGFVSEAKRRLAREVPLPPGYVVTWGGEFANQQRAMKRLGLIVPITVALIFLLLFGSFGSLRQASLIILNVPFALVGGIVALWLSGQYLSVPASVGFIALFGVAVLNGVVLVSTVNDLRRQGHGLETAVYEGTVMRLRPVLMTATVAILGLVPLLVSGGAGSEVQRPLATVVVGGLLTSTALTLLLLPALYGWFEGERPA